MQSFSAVVSRDGLKIDSGCASNAVAKLIVDTNYLALECDGNELVYMQGTISADCESEETMQILNCALLKNDNIMYAKDIADPIAEIIANMNESIATVILMQIVIDIRRLRAVNEAIN